MRPGPSSRVCIACRSACPRCGTSGASTPRGPCKPLWGTVLPPQTSRRIACRRLPPERQCRGRGVSRTHDPTACRTIPTSSTSLPCNSQGMDASCTTAPLSVAGTLYRRALRAAILRACAAGGRGHNYGCTNSTPWQQQPCSPLDTGAGCTLLSRSIPRTFCRRWPQRWSPRACGYACRRRNLCCKL